VAAEETAEVSLRLPVSILQMLKPLDAEEPVGGHAQKPGIFAPHE